MYLTILLPMILLTLGLALCVLNDVYIERRNQRVVLLICALVFILTLQNYADYLLQTRFSHPFARTVCGIIGYSLRPVILVLLCHIVGTKRRFMFAWVAVGLNAAVYLTALFSHLAFWINENNHFQRGPLNKFSFFVSVGLLVYLLFLSIREFRAKKRFKNTILVLPVLMVVGAVILDYHVGSAVQPVTFLTYAIVLSILFYYIWLHLQFVKAHEKTIIDGQRVQIMLSQIKPHFLFNSLEVIRGLYRRDPAAANDAMLTFERYLRGNMDLLFHSGLIPFHTELAHTKLYLELEQLRFPDELTIKYELACTDFLLPPLTLQPLAENAVRHGVRGKKSGRGSVTVATRESNESIEIFVTDDGPGFDPAMLPQDGQEHYGLANVRERLHYAGAKLRLVSAPGMGTQAVISIPKGKPEQTRV